MPRPSSLLFGQAIPNFAAAAKVRFPPLATKHQAYQINRALFIHSWQQPKATVSSSRDHLAQLRRLEHFDLFSPLKQMPSHLNRKRCSDPTFRLNL
jgi:hypothetical protein